VELSEQKQTEKHEAIKRINYLLTMNFISDILYWISTGLLVPVIVLLIILFCRALLLAGSFYGQYMSIRKTEALLRNELGKLTSETVGELNSKLPEKSRSLVIMYMRQVLDARDTPAQVQRLLANFEIAADKDLAISKTLTKLGPILGLMGTLIPMGPALAGLASGDIASMAYNMQIAFATTVVGLVAGAVGFLTQQVKQRWYLQDMTNLEFIAELLNENRTTKTTEK
jgi:biopolymer transport protein ExbB/TolQ